MQGSIEIFLIAKVKEGEMCVFMCACVGAYVFDRKGIHLMIFFLLKTIEGQCMSKCGKIQMAHPFWFRLLHHGM